jgi:hypothetical protein
LKNTGRQNSSGLDAIGFSFVYNALEHGKMLPHFFVCQPVFFRGFKDFCVNVNKCCIMGGKRDSPIFANTKIGDSPIFADTKIGTVPFIP